MLLLLGIELFVYTIFYLSGTNVGAQANEAEIPLLHEYNGTLNENGNSFEVSYVLINT